MNEVAPPSAKAEPIPPPRGWRAVTHHLSEWSEAYLILPLTVASVAGAGLFEYFLTHRDPKENLSWLTDYGSVSIKCALIIVFTSAFKQATGSWLTLEQKIANPYLSTIGDLKTMAAFFGFMYVFLH
jgi:hypothetical protein